MNTLAHPKLGLQSSLIWGFNREIPENKRRVSTLKDIIIARRNAGLNTTIRLRRLITGIGVESLFPLKRSTGISDEDGCKRCNCKETKCLKLNCDCFAAGYYCGQNCSCQGCFNTREYQDTVLDTRQNIVSRDPLAFAPKILQQVGESPANNIQDINKLTPSSTRNERGCNCKKSMCLKRYCQCYKIGF
ncbi:CRC domain-containing protein [Heracleum sosnowskyi]|uniref:CRC domain-containing protein n=1 Tax=Heracleum sosnowskyi TaxID=360622 RepID=A0AAD8MUS8_9APIA|nr:CRC domain-containing protein [Heracleum sosnowskyi]